MAKKTKHKITESWCARCGRTFLIEDFYKSPNPLHETGVLPYCKRCCHDMVNHYRKKYKTLEAGLYYTCADVGMPFIRDVYESFETSIHGVKNVKNYYGNYIKCFYGNQNKATEKIWVDFGASDVSLQDIKNIQTSVTSKEQAEKEMELLWGKGTDESDWEYLEQRYAMYTKDKVLDEYQDTQYRNLCRAELAIYKREPDLKEHLRIQSDCAKILQLDQFGIKKEQTLAERTIESKIDIMEYNDPAEYFKDKGLYKDFRGIKSGWILELMRPLKNILTGSKDYEIEESDMEAFDAKVEQALEGSKDGSQQ